ncbi:helix-turn-helix transcriptional regulator [Yimella sp. cx-573]|nr:helix-turn-helix transcriptional regulator [Yimella sp. cx-573]
MARRHLEALVADGLLVASLAASAGRGRPARVYELTDRGRSLLAGSTDELSVEYVSLTSAFATHIAATSSTPERDARSIGRAWGASLAAKVPERTVVQLLGRLGFSPEPRDERVVALRTCPLLEAARAHPEVVCQVHLGLVQGASAQYGGTGRGGRLDAFAERGACVLQLPR